MLLNIRVARKIVFLIVNNFLILQKFGDNHILNSPNILFYYKNHKNIIFLNLT